MAGDFAAAARHLRDAVALQETELGPSHPDLASTLNNLGVVCERTGDDDEAERCYRRACEIVTAAFPPEHPFVETSRQNLAAFCASHHVPLERPAAAPPARATAAAASTPATIAPPAPPRPEPSRAAPPAFKDESPPRVAATAPRRVENELRVRPFVVGGVAAVIILIGLWMRHSGKDDASPTTSATPVSTSAAPATSAPAPTPAMTSTPAPPPPAPAATSAAVKPAPLPTPAAARPAARESTVAPVLVHAELCRALTTGAEWTCTHPADPASAGAMYFYTRLTSPRDTTVVHRWYRDDRLQQSRELQIHANLGPGYRTYSRITIDQNESGNWRVEVCTTDGRVIEQERFVVR